MLNCLKTKLTTLTNYKCTLVRIGLAVSKILKGTKSNTLKEENLKS